MKVIASQLRKGNVVEMDGNLYVILKAENFHPGKGTPVTQVDMRRIDTGTKVSERWKTTEGVERAHVEESSYTFLYADGEGYHSWTQQLQQIAVTEMWWATSKVLAAGRRCRCTCPSTTRSHRDRGSAEGDVEIMEEPSRW